MKALFLLLPVLFISILSPPNKQLLSFSTAVEYNIVEHNVPVEKKAKKQKKKKYKKKFFKQKRHPQKQRINLTLGIVFTTLAAALFLTSTISAIVLLLSISLYGSFLLGFIPLVIIAGLALIGAIIFLVLGINFFKKYRKGWEKATYPY